MGIIENVFELMTTRLGRIASRTFKPDTLEILEEPDTLEILEVGFGKIRGSKSWIARTMAIPYCTDNEAGLATASNARIRRVNPLIAGGVFLFSKSDDLGSASDSTISSMITEEGGAGVI